MRKLIIILLCLTLTRTLISCCKDAGFNFRWSKAMLTNIDVSSNTPSVIEVDSSKIANYGFRLRFEYEVVAYHFISDFAFNQSYALSCEAYYQNKDSVISIDVLTQNSFDNTHPAGSSIAEYMLARPGDNDSDPRTNPYKPINDNLDYINSANSINRNTLDFRFKNIAPLPVQHTFIVKAFFKSGRTLIDSTSIRLY